MAKSWSKVKAETGHLLDQQAVANAEKVMTEAVRAHRLADIRKQQGPTQTALAEVMGVSQVQVSKIEKGDLSHTQIGTLAAYVEALGGRLEVTVLLGGDALRVK